MAYPVSTSPLACGWWVVDLCLQCQGLAPDHKMMLLESLRTAQAFAFCSLFPKCSQGLSRGFYSRMFPSCCETPVTALSFNS